MSNQNRTAMRSILLAIVFVFAVSGCSQLAPTAAPAATTTAPPAPAQPTATQAPIVPNTANTADTPTPTAEAAPTAETAPVALEKGVLYRDDFKDPASGWPQAVDFDNYFIGYHEPDFYHVEVHAANDRAVVSLPEHTYTDVSLEAQVFTEPNNTAPEGDFRYGLVFHRTGSQYYAFTISPRSQRWYLLKVTPNGTQELESGEIDTLQGLTASDSIRVDVQGTAFFLWINDQMVARATDADFPGGEAGFIVETVDNARVHIHFDEVTVRKVEIPTTQKAVLVEDDFTDPASGWPQSVDFDNYFIGYHEPDYYHVEVHAANDRAVVSLPDKTFTDLTMESQVFTEPNNTAPEGGFRYGLVFHRTGGQFYAFTIHPHEQTWQLLKVSTGGTQELMSGSSDLIQGLSTPDTLRVDVQSPNIYLWINNTLIAQASDDAYTEGEVGFFVETMQNPRVHIHYDSIRVTEVDIPQESCVVVVRGLNLRNGPSTDDRVLTTIRYLEPFEPLGRSPDGFWLRVRTADQFRAGWVSNTSEYFSCTSALEDLPIYAP